MIRDADHSRFGWVPPTHTKAQKKMVLPRSTIYHHSPRYTEGSKHPLIVSGRRGCHGHVWRHAWRLASDAYILAHTRNVYFSCVLEAKIFLEDPCFATKNEPSGARERSVFHESCCERQIEERRDRDVNENARQRLASIRRTGGGQIIQYHRLITGSNLPRMLRVSALHLKYRYSRNI